MAYKIEKETGDIVISGWEQGIAPSPHKGLGNIQSANISTESGEIMCSFERILQSQQVTTATGTFTAFATDTLTYSLGGVTLKAGIWIQIGISSISGLSNSMKLYVNNVNGSLVQFQAAYQGSIFTGMGLTGTATFSILTNMGNPIASATEKYSNGTSFQYRYYILDSNGFVWVNDTALSISGGTWILPDANSLNANGTAASGIAVLNGWLLAFTGNQIQCKPTVLLGAAGQPTGAPGWTAFSPGSMTSLFNSPNPHFAYVGSQGKCYYTDGNFIGSIFPNSSLLSITAPNIQSYCIYTASTSTGTVIDVIGGSLPTVATSATIRIPAFFFSSGAIPSALTLGTVYYISMLPNSATFQVFTALTGGSGPLTIDDGTGTQYFNTFYPISAGGGATITFTPERLDLPFYETAQSITEVGNLVIVGATSNVLYPWDQVSVLPNNLIFLPERNCVHLLTVNNVALAFSGTNGNIYVTNGSSASPVISVPDYCAGIPGTPSSYIEPSFAWGGVMYVRGRVYFSIIDQTVSKAGNCGGIWSFIPTQNFYIQQDAGISLRQENQSSYGTYSGVSNVLLASQDQTPKSPQYWSGWQATFPSPLSFGIDFTDTKPGTSALIETDLIPTGTMLDKKTFMRLEYKLSSPLANGETVSMGYRQNSTDAYVSMGSAVTESATGISGYFPMTFEKGQWVQFQASLNPLNNSSSSFVRLKEMRIKSK